MKAGREYEELVAKIYKDISSDAEVTHDDHLIAYDTGGTTQIDVSIKFTYANIKHLIIIQVKDYNRPADVNVVRTFVQVMKDVRANSGIIICNKGFTGKAKVLAPQYNIELLTVHSAKNKNWETLLQVPIYRILYKFDFDFQLMVPVQEKKEYNFHANHLFSKDEGFTQLDLPAIMEAVSDGVSFRNHKLMSGNDIYFDIKKMGYKWFFNNKWAELEEGLLKVRLISIKHEYCYISPPEYTAIKDHMGNKMRIHHMLIQLPFVELDEKKWRSVKSKSDVITNGYNMGVLEHYDFEQFYIANFMLEKPQ